MKALEGKIRETYQQTCLLLHNWLLLIILVDYVNRRLGQLESNFMSCLDVISFADITEDRRSILYFTPEQFWVVIMPSRYWHQRFFGYLQKCSSFALATRINTLRVVANQARQITELEYQGAAWRDLLQFVTPGALASKPLPDIKKLESLAKDMLDEIVPTRRGRLDMAIEKSNAEKLSGLLEQQKSIHARFQSANFKLYAAVRTAILEMEPVVESIEQSARGLQEINDTAPLMGFDSEKDLQDALNSFTADEVTHEPSISKANRFFGRFLWNMSKELRATAADAQQAFKVLKDIRGRNSELMDLSEARMQKISG